jgi:hypothetical protein
MKIIKQFIKDLPIYINGFCVGWLTFGREYGVLEVVLFAISAITFIIYKNT